MKGRKDIHEHEQNAVQNWVKQLDINREKEVKRLEEEANLEI